MEIKNYYKACGGVLDGTEEQKYKLLESYEKSGLWIAEPKNDGIWFSVFGIDNSGFARSGRQRNHGLPEIGNGNIIIGELAESTEMAIERKQVIGHNFMDVFDIIAYNGKDITKENLMNRKEFLTEWYNNLETDKRKYFPLTNYFTNNFVELYKAQPEGIVLKRRDGIYDVFQWDWIKVKKEATWDMIIIDYELSDAETKSFIPMAKNFIIGQYYNDCLTKMCKVPISVDLGIDVANDFKKYENKVVEVRGFSRTKRGSIRSPRFQRFRDDKPLKDCVFNKE